MLIMGLKAVCLLCSKEMETSNLDKHIKRNHKPEAAGVPEDESHKKCDTCGRSGKGDPVAFTANTIDEINRLLVLVMACHNRPFQMVREQLFIDLVEKLTGGRYSPCSTETLRAYVNKL